MVGHQAIPENAQSGFVRLVAQQGDIESAVGIAKENILLMIAPLRDVMAQPGTTRCC